MDFRVLNYMGCVNCYGFECKLGGIMLMNWEIVSWQKMDELNKLSYKFSGTASKCWDLWFAFFERFIIGGSDGKYTGVRIYVCNYYTDRMSLGWLEQENQGLW